MKPKVKSAAGQQEGLARSWKVDRNPCSFSYVSTPGVQSICLKYLAIALELCFFFFF